MLVLSITPCYFSAMKMKHFVSLALLLSFEILPADWSQAGAVEGAFPKDTEVLQRILQTIPEFEVLWDDQNFRDQFDRYMRYLASPEVQAPDAVYLLNLRDAGVASMDLQFQLFHEMMEFHNWMRLGHQFSDITDKDYFSRHYAAAYPLAHCNAVLAQARVQNAFAEAQGLPAVPMLAYDLVAPDYERRDVLRRKLPTPALARQLRFNRMEFEQPVSSTDIENAIRVFEKGGYAYADSKTLRNAANDFLSLPVSKRLEALKFDSASDCPAIPRQE